MLRDSDGGTVCLICGKKMSYRHDARRHFKMQHLTSETVLECELCGKIQKHHWALGDHMRKVHGQYVKNKWLFDNFKSAKTINCSIIVNPYGNLISNNFLGTNLVDSFLEIGDTTIRCVECTFNADTMKTFSNIQNARRHVRSLHLVQEENLWCSICSAVFTKTRSYDDHMRLRHSIYKKGVKAQLL